MNWTLILSGLSAVAGAVMTAVLAPVVQRLVNRRRQDADTVVMQETSAVANLRSALDALQNENVRLREEADRRVEQARRDAEWTRLEVSRQDQLIRELRSQVTVLERQLAAVHRTPPFGVPEQRAT